MNVAVADTVKGCYVPALESVTIELEEGVEVNNHTLAQAFMKQHPKLFSKIRKNRPNHSITENMLAILARWSVSFCYHEKKCNC